MFLFLPDVVLHAIHKLNDVGFEAYAVGGCVRDSLMGKTPEDWDITTSATPAEMQGVFAEYRTIETGLQHGTLTVIVESTPLEITTYRVDGDYTDGRHPETVAFTRSLPEDLRRRDFTINAMAYHPEHGLVDLYGGQADLLAGVLRCVGDPQQRFSEDALRIMRALRFASVLGFGVESNTDTALRRLSPTLSRVAVERIAVELCKLLCGPDVCRVVSAYGDTLATVMPELRAVTEARLLSIVPAVPRARWAALFWIAKASPEAAESALRRLRMDTHTISDVKRLLSCKNEPTETENDLLRLLNRLGADLVFDYLALCEAKKTTVESVKRLLRENACYQVSMLAVDGNDVIAAGFCAGPDVGTVLHALLEAVMDGKCSNTKTELLDYMKKMEKPVQ